MKMYQSESQSGFRLCTISTQKKKRKKGSPSHREAHKNEMLNLHNISLFTYFLAWFFISTFTFYTSDVQKMLQKLNIQHFWMSRS